MRHGTTGSMSIVMSPFCVLSGRTPFLPKGTGEAGGNSTTPIPRGAWTCFEWQISATGGTGHVVFYVGGGAAPTVTLNKEPIGALIEQRVGYERYNAGVAGSLWIDDYAIGTSRLGCM